jgi:hypothetical protein
MSIAAAGIIYKGPELASDKYSLVAGADAAEARWFS